MNNSDGDVDNVDAFYTDVIEACKSFEKKRGRTEDIEQFQTTLHDLMGNHFPDFPLPTLEIEAPQSKPKTKGYKLSAQMKQFLAKGRVPIHSIPKVSVKSDFKRYTDNNLNRLR